MKHRTSDSFFYLRGGMRSWALGFLSLGEGLSSRTISQVGLDKGTAERLCQSLGYAKYISLSLDSQRGIDFAGDFYPNLPDAGILVRDMFDQLSSDNIVKHFYGITCVLSRTKSGLISILNFGEFAPDADKYYPRCDDEQMYLGWCAANAGPTSPVTVPFLADALGCSDGQLLGKLPYNPEDYMPRWFTPEDKRKGVAKREVNIRSVPGLVTQPIGTLPQNSPVQIEDCAITDDSQGVWFKIKSDRHSGWVSARFILESTIFLMPVTN